MSDSDSTTTEFTLPQKDFPSDPIIVPGFSFPSLGVKVTASETVAQHYSGPIPNSEEMAKYKDISPDLPDRIMRMAEEEQRSRLLSTRAEDERKAIALKINSRNTLLGLILSFMVIFVILAAAIWCAVIGHPITAGAIGSGGLVAIAAVFVYGSKVKPFEKS